MNPPLPVKENLTDLVYRLRKRASIRLQISTRKSVQEGTPDRIAALLNEAADTIEELTQMKDQNVPLRPNDNPL
jgi:hypothetical protein